MQLLITKYQDKKNVIKYIRNNGTETWMYSDDFFVLHDLSHFALEKTLGYTTAFMGMLNNGTSIQDFEDRVTRNKLTITKEALYAENMANLFLMETVQGNFTNLNEVIKQAHEAVTTNCPAPVLTEENITNIRTTVRHLISTWRRLPAGKTLQLEYII